jgi:spectinomycin phosphotransferase
MLTPPDLSDEIINACVRDTFGLHIVQAIFLPIGADVNSAVYRVTADDGTPYFLKLRRGNSNEVAATVPAWLHAQGIPQVMAPLATTTGAWWTQLQGFAWMLYPFFMGRNGFEVAWSSAQWIALGTSMRTVHATRLPAALEARVPREAFAPHNRQIVQTFDQQVAQHVYDDPIAERLAAFWMHNHAELHTIVEHAEQLAQALQQRHDTLVVCHADLHAGNVLVGANDTLAIVDWDELILAPKERDLMFVGAGIGGVWNTGDEETLFYQGYGAAEVDPRVLAYYRYERIVADIAAYAEQIFGMQGSAADRAQGLRELMEQFHPNSVVEIAHRSYMALA